jgi:hypothetical protein
VDIAFVEHVDLLDLHGRAAVASLGQLGPTDTLPPHGVPAHRATREHWATLEIWAWSLEHPSEHWSDRAEPTPPSDHPDVVAAVAYEVTHLEDLLLAAGDAQPIDYFGRPGTTAEVARLLAHEAITVAHAASLAAGRASPALSPAVAADGIDRALHHWSEPDAQVVWRPERVELRTTDATRSWFVECGLSRRGDDGAFRPAATRDAAAVVSADAATLLWWMHGHPMPDEILEVSGADQDLVTALRHGMGHVVEPAPVRRTWWRR